MESNDMSLATEVREALLDRLVTFGMLNTAVKVGHLPTIRSLLENGADVNCVDDNGNSPLLNACLLGPSSESTTIVRWLLERGANVNFKNCNTGHTSMMAASQFGPTANAALLLEYKANINEKDDQGNTPLLFACRAGCKDMVHLLLDGADVNAQNHEGETALHLWCRHGSHDMVEALLEKGADVNAQDWREHETALLIAARAGDEPIVHLLLEYGANVHKSNIHGVTPLAAALVCGHSQLSTLLRTKGAVLCRHWHCGSYSAETLGGLVWKIGRESIQSLPIVKFLVRMGE